MLSTGNNVKKNIRCDCANPPTTIPTRKNFTLAKAPHRAQTFYISGAPLFLLFTVDNFAPSHSLNSLKPFVLYSQQFIISRLYPALLNVHFKKGEHH